MRRGRFALSQRSLLQILATGLIIWIMMSKSVSAVERTSDDRRSLAHLFGDSLSQNALEVYRVSRQMPVQQRYRYLRRQVLPSYSDEIRLSVDYLPTNPSPPVVQMYGTGDLPPMFPSTATRKPSGGALVSPAIELVKVAESLGKLDELWEQVRQRSSSAVEQLKAKSALLTLIAAAEEDREQFASRLSEFSTLVRTTPVTDPERAPEMVVFWQGMQSEEMRPELFDLLTYLRARMRYDKLGHSNEVRRHLSSLSHLLEEELARKSAPSPVRFDERPLRHWHVASRAKAETRGNGYPNAVWTSTPGRACRLFTHDFDYLYFDSPLRGDFEIEGELSTFGKRGTRLVVGTIFAGPVYGRKVIYSGSFRQRPRRIQVDPKFSRFEGPMRAREVVRDGIRTLSINGREVLEFPQGAQNDPWIGAVSPPLTSGEMVNVRITGKPEIPDEIDLIAHPELPGWLPYFVSFTTDRWRLQLPQSPSLIERLNRLRDEPPAVLTARKDRSLTGRSKERLLRYHRPMVEDGTIEYEFFYQSGQYAVYPALDRCCFLFDSEQAGIHWLTDGKFDRTGLDPSNFTPSGESETVPLKENDWNRVQLTLKGDDVRIVLNGETILARTLEPENLRTFGLFHYAEQTAVMVRNLRWRGEWPKELPPPREQQLADFTLEDELARGPELRTVFEHDFSEGLPLDEIWVTGRNWQELTDGRPNGLRMRRPGGSYDLYEKTSLSLPFRLQGDFDITWEFADFQSNLVENGNGNVHILLLFDDDKSTECRLFRLYRQQGFPDNGDHSQLAQVAVFDRQPDGKKRFTHPGSVPEESAGGKLRVVRRGSTLYFLYAETDSGHFRLVYQSDITDAPIRFGGIKGIIETHKAGETDVLWKRVTLKAEPFPAELDSRNFTLEQLDRQRSQLESSLSIDLNQETDPKLVAVGEESTHVTRESDGWLVRQPGFENWQGTEIKPGVSVRGDFDIALELDVLKLEQSQTGSKSTVYLHAGFDTSPPLGMEINCSRIAGSPRSLEIRVTTAARDGGLRYDELKRLKADRVTQLRIARRGSFAYLIARRAPASEPEILGRIDVKTADVTPDSLRTLVHTGGTGQETVVRFKSMQIHADEIIEP
jgi:hypothetical protein